MIRCDNGELEMSGIEPEIMADLSVIIRHFRKVFGKTADDKLEQILKVAYMTDEEIIARNKRIRESSPEVVAAFEEMERSMRARRER